MRNIRFFGGCNSASSSWTWRLLPLVLGIGLLGACADGDEEKEPEPPPPPTPASIFFEQEALRLDAIGASARITAAVLDAEGRPLPEQTLRWSSSDPLVADVDDGGLVTARQNGRADIEARLGELRASLPVTVAQIANQVRLQPDALHFGAIGATRKLQVEARDSGGHVLSAPPIVWRSSDDSVALVDAEGLVIAVQPGEAEVSATVEGTTASASVRVVVAPRPTGLGLELALPSFVAGVGSDIQVQVVDDNGHPVVGARHKVSLRLGENPHHSTLSGRLVSNAVDGVATFEGVALDRAGPGYTLVASVEGLGTVESSAFEVTPGAAARLAFSVQPSRTASEEPIGPAVEVEVQDALGNRVTATPTVAIALGRNDSGGILAGTLEAPAVDGRARFENLSVDKAGRYTLVAESAELQGAESAAFEVVAGSAARLAFLVQPQDAVSGQAFPRAPAVEIQDRAGNRVTQPLQVRIGLRKNPGGDTLRGPLSVESREGVATFPGLSLQVAREGYSLIASSGSLSEAVSADFDVLPGSPVALAFAQQPANATSGLPMNEVRVHALDAAGNPVPGATGSVTLRLEQNATGAILGGGSSHLVSGEARFTALTIDRAGKGYTLRASASGMGSVTSAPFDVAAGAAASIAFLSEPASGTSGVALQPVRVEVRDAAGNRVETSGTSITLALGQNPAGGSLSGGSATTQQGVATFSDLRIDKAGTGYTLRASSSHGSAESAPFAIAPGAATKLAFHQQPQSGASGKSLPLVQVEVRDAADNRVSTGSHSIELALLPANQGTLSGPRQASTVNGIAAFGGLSVDMQGTYQLRASSGTLADATSTDFHIGAGAPARLAFRTQPPASVTALAPIPAIEVEVRDAAGNLVDASGVVSLALAQNPGQASLSGARSAALSGGVATFTGLQIDKAGAGYTLRATLGALDGTSAPFDVVPGSAARLAFVREPVGGTAGAPLGAVEVEVQDAAGNWVGSGSHALRIELAQNPGGGSLSGGKSATSHNGIATFAGLQIDKAGAGYSLQVSGLGAPVESRPFDIAPAAAAKLAFRIQPQTTPSGKALPPVQVEVLDAQGNRVRSQHTVQIALIAENGATLGGNRSAATVDGIATFSSLVVTQKGAGYRLRASVAPFQDVESEAFDILAGEASRLAFLRSPAEAVAGEPFAPAVEVEIQDAAGNRVDGATNTITLSLGQHPPGAVLEGVRSASAVDGIASFPGLSLSTSGMAYTLRASALALTGTESGVFPVRAGEVASIVFLAEPQDHVAGGGPGTIQVELLDHLGNRILEPTQVSVSLQEADAVLHGTTATTSQNGIATFPDLRIDQSGSFTLLVHAKAITQASRSFQVQPGAAKALAFSVQPADAKVDTEMAPVTVEVRDHLGNRVPTGNHEIHLELVPASAQLSGVLQGITAGGLFTFTGLAVDTPGSYRLRATAQGFDPVESDAFGITTGSPDHLVFLTQPADGVAGVQTASVEVMIVDAGGHRIVGATDSVRLELQKHPSKELVESWEVDAVNGIATFNGPSILEAGSYVLVASSGTLGPAESAPFPIASAPVHELIVQGPTAPIQAGDDFAVEVSAFDAFGNPVQDEIEIELALEGGAGGPLLGITSGNTTTGTLSFSGLSIERAGEGYELVATVVGKSADGRSAPFDVQAAPAETLAWKQPPSTPSRSGDNLGPLEVHVLDRFGNPVDWHVGEVSLTLLSKDGDEESAATLSGDLLAAFVDGIATFATASVDLVGTYRLGAESAGITGIFASDTFEILPGSLSKARFLSYPTAGVVSLHPFDVVVELLDAAGNTATDAVENISLTLAAGPGTFAGDRGPKAPTQGIVTFSGLTLDKAATDYRLRAEWEDASETGALFEVKAGPPFSIEFSTLPPTVTSMVEFTVGVRLLDEAGNVAVGASDPVQLTFASNEPQGTLTGNDPKAPTAGSAIWQKLTIDKMGQYTLQATYQTLEDFHDIQVTPGLPVKLAFTQSPPPSLESASPFSVTIQVQDAGGNRVPLSEPTVELQFEKNPWNGILSGGTSKKASQGEVSFSGLSIDKAGPGYQLKATAGIFQPAISQSPGSPDGTFTVYPGPIAGMKFVAAPEGGTVGEALDPAPEVALLDQAGNIVDKEGVDVDLDMDLSPSGAKITGEVYTQTAADGIAYFKEVFLDQPGDYVLIAKSEYGEAWTEKFTVADAVADDPKACGPQETVCAFNQGCYQGSCRTMQIATAGLEDGMVMTSARGHSCALLANGRVRCWGRNNNGQLGIGSTTDVHTPTELDFGTDGDGKPHVVEHIAIGPDHGCALLATGDVKCWGNNNVNQVNHQLTLRHTSPAPVDLKGAAARHVDVGRDHSCAVMKDDGSVRCWGSNSNSKIGSGAGTTVGQPHEILTAAGGPPLTNITQIAAGRAHTCALTSGQNVYCWGNSDLGQLGHNAFGDIAYPAMAGNILTPLGGVVGISTSNNHVCVTTENSEVYCWGDDSKGQVGRPNPQAQPQRTPFKVSSITNARSVSAGELHSCAVLSNNQARCWGFNGTGDTQFRGGQLGIGNKNDTRSPTAVVTSSGLLTARSDVGSIAAAYWHSCGIFDHQFYCWGQNKYGQLGLPALAETSRPALVPDLP